MNDILFENRHHRVKLVNNNYKSCSSCRTVKHGVLQGSILGPFLFLFYINDITKITNIKYNNNESKLAVFVDDTSLIITTPNSTEFIWVVDKY